MSDSQRYSLKLCLIKNACQILIFYLKIDYCSFAIINFRITGLKLSEFNIFLAQH